MKNYHLIIVTLCLLLSSCAAVSYLGDKLPPTNTVDIFYSAHDVTRSYKVIGHLSCPNGRVEGVKAQLTDYAKKIGADAIVITGIGEPNNDNRTGVANADALKYTN